MARKRSKKQTQQDEVDAFYAGIGMRIRKARDRAGMTQEVLAERLRLNRTSVTNIERGRQRLLLHTFVEVAMALGVTPAKLLPNDGAADDDTLDYLLRDRPESVAEWIRVTVKGRVK